MCDKEYLFNLLYTMNVIAPLIYGTFDNVINVEYFQYCEGRYRSIRVTYKDRKHKYICITNCKNRREIALRALHYL